VWPRSHPAPWAMSHGPWAMGHEPWAMSHGPALRHPIILFASVRAPAVARSPSSPPPRVRYIGPIPALINLRAVGHPPPIRHPSPRGCRVDVEAMLMSRLARRSQVGLQSLPQKIINQVPSDPAEWVCLSYPPARVQNLSSFATSPVRSLVWDQSPEMVFQDR